jgi:hypothetical protein
MSTEEQAYAEFVEREEQHAYFQHLTRQWAYEDPERALEHLEGAVGRDCFIDYMERAYQLWAEKRA